jgi:hypothetical protein
MKQKTHVTPKKSSTTSSNKQADILLRQIRMESAVKDLAKSNKRMGIINTNNNNQPTTTQATQTTTTAKSKKK